jgi:hypothetical protein
MRVLGLAAAGSAGNASAAGGLVFEGRVEEGLDGGLEGGFDVDVEGVAQGRLREGWDWLLRLLNGVGSAGKGLDIGFKFPFEFPFRLEPESDSPQDACLDTALLDDCAVEDLSLNTLFPPRLADADGAWLPGRAG